MSRRPGPSGHAALVLWMPARTPGSLGIRDAGDPDVLAVGGDTPGTLGLHDGAADFDDALLNGGESDDPEAVADDTPEDLSNTFGEDSRVRASDSANFLALQPPGLGVLRLHSPASLSRNIDPDIDALVDRAFDDMLSEEIKGGQHPVIAGHRIPTKKSVRVDIEDIPRQIGETARQALDRVRAVIGKKLSDIPEVRVAWDSARQAILQQRSLDSSNYKALYNLARRRFWQEVRRSSARDFFIKAGFRFPKRTTSAPLLGVSKPGVRLSETLISLDHIEEKAIGENWRRALDADNLRMEFAMPNTYREIIQARHPELRH
jgi:hypothetical protein